MAQIRCPRPMRSHIRLALDSWSRISKLPHYTRLSRVVSCASQYGRRPAPSDGNRTCDRKHARGAAVAWAGMRDARATLSAGPRQQSRLLVMRTPTHHQLEPLYFRSPGQNEGVSLIFSRVAIAYSINPAPRDSLARPPARPLARASFAPNGRRLPWEANRAAGRRLRLPTKTKEHVCASLLHPRALSRVTVRWGGQRAKRCEGKGVFPASPAALRVRFSTVPLADPSLVAKEPPSSIPP